MNINNLILVCSAPDLEVLKFGLSYIERNIEYSKCYLCVPKKDKHLFANVIPKNGELIYDEFFTEIITLDEIRAWLPLELQHRAGWYLQQFLKIILATKGEADQINLIWDADTIPLKKMVFFRSDKVLFNFGFERHGPYFNTIQKQFGMKRQTVFSFICQYMPVKVSWLQAMHNNDLRGFFFMILNSIEKTNQSEFSEYETIGNFVFKHFPSESKLYYRMWHRNAGRYIGFKPKSKITRFFIKVYSIFFYYVSYEKFNIRQ